MRIKVGACSLEEIEYFANAGAGEVYFGLSDIPSHVAASSRNIAKFDINRLVKTVRFAHEKDCGVYLAVNDINALDYGEIPQKMFELVNKAGIDGFIVSSLDLLHRYPQGGIKPQWHLSTLANCYNRSTIEFFRDKGFTRFVFPEQLMPEDVTSMLNIPNTEIEVFFLYDDSCMNFDSICLGCSPENLDNGRKFCGRSFFFPDGIYKPPDLSIETEARCMYFYSHTASWLKLVRKRGFERRKAVLAEVQKLLKLSEKCDNTDVFWEISRSVFLELRKITNAK